MSRRLSDDANLSLDNEQSLLSVKFDAQVLKKKWCGHDAHLLFVSLTAIVPRGALTFLYIYYFFHWYLYSRVEKQGMLVVCFVLRSERRSFIATRLNTYIYLQRTTLIFFSPATFLPPDEKVLRAVLIPKHDRFIYLSSYRNLGTRLRKFVGVLTRKHLLPDTIVKNTMYRANMQNKILHSTIIFVGENFP